MIKAIFLDIDGTLVGLDNQVSPRVIETVKRARDKGIHVLICTGRTWLTAKTVADQIGAGEYIILANGAILMDLKREQVLCRNVLPHEHALKAAQVVWEAGLAPTVFEDGLSSNRILYHPDRVPRFFRKDRFHPCPEMLESLPFDALCVCFYDDKGRAQPLVPVIRDGVSDFAQVIEGGGEHYWGGDIYPLSAGKCGGLQAILDKIGVQQEETLAIGDNLNDLEMIQWAGVGVAMGNGMTLLKEYADWVAPSVEEDGVAVALERFAL